MSPLTYHWRAAGGAKVDIVLERDDRLYPIAVKCKTNLTGHDTRGLRAFHDTYSNAEVMPGLVVYCGTECFQMNECAIALPWNVRVRTVPLPGSPGLGE